MVSHIGVLGLLLTSTRERVVLPLLMAGPGLSALEAALLAVGGLGASHAGIGLLASTAVLVEALIYGVVCAAFRARGGALVLAGWFVARSLLSYLPAWVDEAPTAFLAVSGALGVAGCAALVSLRGWLRSTLGLTGGG